MVSLDGINQPILNRVDVSKRGSRIPERLKNDAIIEAIFELRFKTTTQPEFLVVRLADHEPWKSFSQARLPAYGIPENIRQVDPNFTYQPIFELTEPNQHRAIKIGPSVLSYHLRQPYVGWATFQRELNATTTKLFQCAEHLVLNRLGLRYVNALSSKLHGIGSIADLDLSLTVAGTRVEGKVNVNFIALGSGSSDGAVRVASPEFVFPRMPNEASVLVDVDIFTKAGFEAREEEPVLEWLENAHTTEKQEFFCLLTDETISRLKEN
jgi:uncharacterized protein (TIGR04255 family)